MFLGVIENRELLSKRKILECQLESLLETDSQKSNQAKERFDHGYPACHREIRTSTLSMRTKFWQRTGAEYGKGGCKTRNLAYSEHVRVLYQQLEKLHGHLTSQVVWHGHDDSSS